MSGTFRNNIRYQAPSHVSRRVIVFIILVGTVSAISGSSSACMAGYKLPCRCIEYGTAVAEAAIHIFVRIFKASYYLQSRTVGDKLAHVQRIPMSVSCTVETFSVACDGCRTIKYLIVTVPV